MQIGVFDSGIGGLTVFDALDRALPEHSLLYLGDTARVPYGTRSPRTVIRYARRVASYLVDQGVDAIVIACNTATAHALEDLQEGAEQIGLPVFGVIEPGVRAALEAHQQGAIVVLGTEGTVRGGAYQRALAAAHPGLEIEAVACPLFVPLAEEGWTTGPVPTQVAEAYVGHLRGRVDTAILGCTHYPLLKDVIAHTLPGVVLVDSAEATAAAVRQAVGPPRSGKATRRFLVTDHVSRFQSVGERFLRTRPDPVEWVDLPPAAAPFDRELASAR